MRLRGNILLIGVLIILWIVSHLASQKVADAANGITGENIPYPPPRGDTYRWYLYCNGKDNTAQEGYSELNYWINYYDQYDRIDNGTKWSTDISEYR
jgi:hypothetical protein